MCASEEAGVSFYNVSDDVVMQAICRDPNYSDMLERVLESPRHARTLRYTLRAVQTAGTLALGLVGGKLWSQ